MSCDSHIHSIIQVECTALTLEYTNRFIIVVHTYPSRSPCFSGYGQTRVLQIEISEKIWRINFERNSNLRRSIFIAWEYSSRSRRAVDKRSIILFFKESSSYTLLTDSATSLYSSLFLDFFENPYQYFNNLSTLDNTRLLIVTSTITQSSLKKCNKFMHCTVLEFLSYMIFENKNCNFKQNLKKKTVKYLH